MDRLLFYNLNKESDDVDSLFFYGLFLYENKANESIQYFEKAAEKGKDDAKFLLAKMHEEGKE